MSEIVNLKRARKTQARAAAKRMAEANRVAHGRSKSETAANRIERERADRLLDGARREPPQD